MLKAKLIPANQGKQKLGIPTQWDHEESREQEQQMEEGVGRAGAPLQPSSVPGLSRSSVARIREMGTARIRIARPGNIRTSKKPPERKRKAD